MRKTLCPLRLNKKMKPIIKVENLSKQYTIGGAKEPYSTFRESLVKAARVPLNAFKRRNKENVDNRFWALKDINFAVEPGEVVGIIGRNGAGKSTLLKILSRITEPTKGKVELYGRVGSLLEVGTGFHPELTGRENIYLNGAILGMKREEISKKFDEIVDFAEIENFLDTPVKRYSSGMYVRLAFAVAAHLESEIIIVDEVLAVGDTEFQKKCLGKMKNVSQSGRTVLFVSHSMTAVQTLCNLCILLEKGQIKSFNKTNIVIRDYLNTSKSNYRTFDKGLKWARITQEENNIIIECEYDLKNLIDIPHLGFVVSNSLGSPVFASNPSIENLDFSIYEKTLKGKITVIIKQPKLLDGDYWLSIWFGDSKENFFEEKDALCFQVSAMTKQKQNSQLMVGNVLPLCEWIFQ